MLPKSLSQPVRPCPVARQHQNPAGIFINPVHQFGLFIQFKPQCLQHTVNMAAGVGTALHRQTGGFVQNNNIVVFINNQRENKLRITAGNFRTIRSGFRLFIHRRYSHFTACRQFQRCFGPFAVNFDLLRPQQFLQPPQRQIGIIFHKPAVQTHSVIFRFHLFYFHSRHFIPLLNFRQFKLIFADLQI